MNDVVRTAFAGSVAGQVFEGERRFDLVVRARSQSRSDLSDVQRLLVPTPMGKPVPLSLLADVRIEDGPNQVQREDAKRRITVGFNVRGRDVQSIVEELQGKVDAQLDLPVGYYTTYGGAFENLVEAKKRLVVVVPLALLLILLLLYFAFGSLKLSLLVFSAVPLSAIGGVFALAGRGMPFSISAGVGFIALFGVAVLNGIVLISEFEHLAKNGLKDVGRTHPAGHGDPLASGADDRQRGLARLPAHGPEQRCRCGSATSLGHGGHRRPAHRHAAHALRASRACTCWRSASSEERRDEGSEARRGRSILLALLGAPLATHAQSTVLPITLEQAVDSAMRNNLYLKGAALRSEAEEALIGSGWDLPQTNIDFEYGQVNTNANDDRISLSQSLSFPTVYAQRRKMLKHNAAGVRWEQALRQREVRTQVKQSYHEVLVLREQLRLATGGRQHLHAGRHR